METQAPNLQLDLLCETLGISLETLAERAGVTPGDFYITGDGRWYPIALARLSNYLGVSPDFLAIPPVYLTELLKAFSVVEPSHRLRLIDKIWSIETVSRIVLRDCVFAPTESLCLSDLLEAFENQCETGHRSFVAFVRQQIDNSDLLLFSHPFGNHEYTAILFVPNERNSAFKYLIVNENKQLSPLTNALFQWYEVLRLLSRWDNEDDENGFSINPEASWSAIYLERTVGGYCPRLNEQLRKHFVSNYHISDILDPNQYRWYPILVALMEGLPPAVVAELLSHTVKIDGEESVDSIVRSLDQTVMIDEIVELFMAQRVVPTNYDWVIPSYPSYVQYIALEAIARGRIQPHVALSVLPTSKWEYDTLSKRVEQLGMYDLSTKR
jgi:hypothetical protein